MIYLKIDIQSDRNWIILKSLPIPCWKYRISDLPEKIKKQIMSPHRCSRNWIPALSEIGTNQEQRLCRLRVPRSWSQEIRENSEENPAKSKNKAWNKQKIIENFIMFVQSPPTSQTGISTKRSSQCHQLEMYVNIGSDRENVAIPIISIFLKMKRKMGFF